MVAHYTILLPCVYFFVSSFLSSVSCLSDDPCPSGYHYSEVSCRTTCSKDCSKSTTLSAPACKWRCPYAPTFTDFKLSCDRGYFHDPTTCENHCDDPCRYLLSRDLSNCNYQCPNHQKFGVILLIFAVVFVLVLALACLICFLHPACPCRQRYMARQGGPPPVIAPGTQTHMNKAYMEHDGPAIATRPHPNDDNEGPDRLPELAVPVEPNLVARQPPNAHYGYL